ncbi:MAG TPA: LysM peptidoglycan-binding domain-containing protein [Acidobacteriota bacterium]|nr:LysM peptidoglycan-binding domain-containing protein [Acidobacteriota bacterium]
MLEKAYLARKDDQSTKISFLFNPKELSVEKSNQFSEVSIPGLPSPIFQFVKGNARSVTLDLFFDTYEKGEDVRNFTDKITGWDAGSMLSRLPDSPKGLMDIDSGLHAPPICLFIWGAFTFQCIIERASKKFTMFLPEGIPVRATLNVTLKEYREVDIQVKEVAFESSDLTKRWVVAQGDSLWFIAAKEYGDPKDWRRIADANKLDNPRLIFPGQEIAIPIKK